MIREKDKGKLIDYLVSLKLLLPNIASELKKDDALITEFVANMKSDNGPVSISFAVARDDEKKFTIDDFTITQLKAPEVDHTICLETDTRELEERMSGITWKRDDIIMEGANSAIGKAFKDVIRLRLFGDQKAKDVADMLILKYWMQSPVITLLPPGIDFTKYTIELTVPLNGNTNDLNLLEAMRLLEGGSIKRFDDINKSTALTGEWLVAEQGQVITLPDFDLTEIIGALPFSVPTDALTQTDLYFKLSDGKRPEVSLISNGTVQKVVIEVNARDRNLNFYNSGGDKLQSDLFKTPDEKEQKTKQAPQAKSPNAKRKPRKGRGI